MKISKRSLIIIISSVALVLLVAGILIMVNSKNFKPQVRVAYYELTDGQKKAITTQLQSLTTNKGIKPSYTFTDLDPAAPLLSQLKNRYDVVFTPLGKNATTVVSSISKKNEEKVSLPQSVLDGATISVHQEALQNADGTIAALPLLLDHYEIDIDRTVLNQCGIKTIASWHDIEAFAFAAQKYIKSPIVFAGGDYDTFLGIFGALVESFSGKQAYETAVSTLTKAMDDAEKNKITLNGADYDTLIKQLSETANAPFYNAVQIMARWQRLGLLNQETFHMTKADVSAFMEAKNAAIVFMTLAQHRDVEHNTIERYSSIYYPSEQSATLRFFSAPVISGVPLTKNKNMQSVVAKLASSDIQEQLSRDSGLAPIQANCRVADHQADDVRYWIAATNAPVAPLGKAVFTDAASEKAFADQLASYVRFLPQ